MRKDLFDLLRFGVEWRGTIPPRPGSTDTPLDAAEVLGRRREHVVLKGIAEALGSRRPQAGVRLPMTVLSGGVYKRSSVASALEVLVRAGIVRRERSRLARGELHEDTARTFVHPALLAAAIFHAETWAALRKVDGKARAPRVLIEIPLVGTWDGGSQVLARVPKGQHPIYARCSIQKLDGVFHTHPPPQ